MTAWDDPNADALVDLRRMASRYDVVPGRDPDADDARTREPITCHDVTLPGGALAPEDLAVLAEFAEALTARARVVYLQPARPVWFRTPRRMWAWGALGLRCREPVDGGVRCKVCAPCEARVEALRVWCP